MLLKLRHITRGWIAGVILGVLVIAFALWGVNDVFNGVGSAHVASVGREEITPNQLSRLLDRVVRIERDNGADITRADAISANLHLRLLEEMIGQRAGWEYARALGVGASDTMVADQIRQIPGVQDQLSGSFSEQSYNQFLQQIGYTRSELEHEIRGDMSYGMVRAAMTAGARAPSSYGKLWLAYQSERRTITVAEAPIALAGNIPAPNDAQIQDFYEEMAPRLQVPEYRAVTVVAARQSDFVARVDIPAERLREEFESRRVALATPETRSLIQISAPDETKARDAAARMAAGEAPEAAAQALGLQVVRYEDSERREIADAGVGEAAFAMNPGEAPRAVRGRLTPWAAIALVAVTPAAEPSFDAVVDELRADIAAIEASDLMNEAISAFEDSRSAGASVQEAARGAGLAVVSVPAVSRQGTDPQGAPVAALAEGDLLTAAFETQEGEATEFLPGPDNSELLVSVDGVTPQTTRPLEEVREDLVRLWTERERLRRLQDIGREVAEAVAGGQDFVAAARARRLNIVARSQPIDRASTQQLPARRLGAELFEARIGQVVSDMRADGQSLVLGVVEAIERDDPAAAEAQVEIGRAQMEQSLAQTLDETLQAAARTRANARRNERLIERVFPASDPEADDAL